MTEEVNPLEPPSVMEATAAFHFTADGITPAMAAQMPEGKGSRYQTTYKDKDGKFFDGSKTYKVNVAPGVPVALFWAVTVYVPGPDPIHGTTVPAMPLSS